MRREKERAVAKVRRAGEGPISKPGLPAGGRVLPGGLK
jgi:hypothetical protein